MLSQPTRCIKTYREGITLYLDSRDSKFCRGDLVLTPEGVTVEPPGWSNTGLPAVDFAARLLSYEPPAGVTHIEMPLAGGVGVSHAFIADCYRTGPGPVYDVMSAFVEDHFKTYVVPVEVAKASAARYLDDLRKHNPQD